LNEILVLNSQEFEIFVFRLAANTAQPSGRPRRFRAAFGYYGRASRAARGARSLFDHIQEQLDHEQGNQLVLLPQGMNQL
jgi:hypothetical protein